MKTDQWDARLARAREMGAKYRFAAEGLLFYEQLAFFQKSLHGALQQTNASLTALYARTKPQNEPNFDFLLAHFPAFLSCIEQNAPGTLSAAARDLRKRSRSNWQDTLGGFWNGSRSGEVGAAEMLLSWMFLQPYAEFLAEHCGKIPAETTPSHCPLCSEKPLVGVLRPEGEGGRRSLICGFCSTEWVYRRILCPACGEQDVHKLPVYTAESFKHVRVETCDSCRSYIKTVDFTKDGRAVPIVDELMSIPLDLWAAEHGYSKIRTNILGL
jgi:formate dehydrogenase accessory protein FdhE